MTEWVCSCPDFALMHKALISNDDVSAANALGYADLATAYTAEQPPAVWLGKPTYSSMDSDTRYMLTYDHSWRFVLNENMVIGQPDYYNLVYYPNPQCKIAPSVGIDVGPDFHLDRKEIDAGEFTYLAHYVSDQNGDLLNVNYCTDIDTEHTCFLVNNVDQCIQLAEEVLMTIEIAFPYTGP